VRPVRSQLSLHSPMEHTLKLPLGNPADTWPAISNSSRLTTQVDIVTEPTNLIIRVTRQITPAEMSVNGTVVDGIPWIFAEQVEIAGRRPLCPIEILPAATSIYKLDKGTDMSLDSMAKIIKLITNSEEVVISLCVKFGRVISSRIKTVKFVESV